MQKPKYTKKTQRGIGGESQYFDEFFRFSEKLRKRISVLRKEHKLTQEQMQDFEINLRQYQRIESGESGNITLSMLYKLAKAFGLKPKELLDL